MVSQWLGWIFIFLMGVFCISSSPFLIFNPDYYKGRFNWKMIYGYLEWIWLVANIVYTVIYVIKLRKQKENVSEDGERS